ncbi:MAG TPA: DUF1549 domain-containing protein [Gemmataceae bacterium]|nr:DUF1549 domain-containing protein [Gemmataceae bacterium]
MRRPFPWLLSAVFLAFSAAPLTAADPPPPFPHAANSPRSPDGKVAVASNSSGVLFLREPSTQKELHTLHGHTGPVHATVFSPDSRYLASGGHDGTVRLWSVASGKDIVVLRGHEKPVRSLAFSPDGRFLASGGEDQSVRVWEIASGQEALRLRGPANPGLHVGFRPDGKALLSADPEDGTLVAWDLATTKPLGRWALQRLSIAVGESVLPKGSRTKLRVQAHWSGGVTQDVTRWAACESVDGDVARVKPDGRVEALGAGRAVVAARYLGREAAVAVTVPYAALDNYPRLPTVNFIDEILSAEWKRAGLRPVELASDTTFLRRVFLHLTGSLPTPDDVRRFLDSKDPAKRRKLIDALLDRPEFVDHWSRQWGTLLRVEDKRLGAAEKSSFRNWIQKAVRENWPADRLARELLLARGEVKANGAAAFFLIDPTPADLAETTAQVFLGVDLRCARCHRHPGGEWSREDHLGLSAFFARIERRGGEPSVRLAKTGTLTHPSTRKAVTPRLPVPPEVAVGKDADPVEPLAKWLTHADNPLFARSIVNRYWAHLFGQGLAESCHDLRPANLACHPTLLDALARDFARNKYDIKHLLRTICTSRVYQLDHKPLLPEDKVLFSRRRLRRVEGELLIRMIAQATGVKREVLQGVGGFPGLGEDAGPFRRLPPGRGQDACERPNPEAMLQAPGGLAAGLHLMNSDLVSRAIMHPEGRIARLIAAGAKDEKIIEELFLATLSHPATPAQNRSAQAHVSKAKGAEARKTALQDVLWALLNSKEFLFIP